MKKKTSRRAQGPRKHPPAIRYRVFQHGVGTAESSLLKSEAIRLYKDLRRSSPDDLVTVEAFAVPRHYSGKRLTYATRRGKKRDVTDLFEKEIGMERNRFVSKNSRKARLRRNADGGPNFLLLGGLALGGYLAYRWLSDKSSKAAPRPVVAPASASKAPAAPALPVPPAMPAAPALPSVQMPAAPSLPAPESDWHASATVEELDAAAKAADPGKATSGIGNYYNDGE